MKINEEQMKSLETAVGKFNQSGGYGIFFDANTGLSFARLCKIDHVPDNYFLLALQDEYDYQKANIQALVDEIGVIEPGMDTTLIILNKEWRKIQWNESLIETYRRRAGLTQKELSEKSGIGVRQLQSMEYGQIDLKNISLKNALALADALGVEPKDLIK